MRFIIYGIGAVGGTLAVKLTLAGHEVVGIARGAQLEAIRDDGLTVKTPNGDEHAKFDCVAHPAEIDLRPDDVVFLCMKSQHTQSALEALQAAGAQSQTIVCMQNGVANETMALRYFENVIGAVIMMPCTYLNPGKVAVYGVPRHGIFDLGSVPRGTSETVATICDALDAANFAAFAHADIMRAKYGKLILNLVNGVDPVLGPSARDGKYGKMVRAEGRAVLEVAGIAYDPVGKPDPERQALMTDGKVPDLPSPGSSGLQSLARGAGSTEVDYLNGEIALLGRLHGVPTPANAFFMALTNQFVRENRAVASLNEEDVDALFDQWCAQIAG